MAGSKRAMGPIRVRWGLVLFPSPSLADPLGRVELAASAIISTVR